MSRLDKLAENRWLGWLAAFGLFLLSRPYQGVRHDGRLYVADALAKLDPGGVGKDLMFVHDGQFGFSLYTPLLSRLIGALGVSAGTMAVVLLTLVLWFAALVFLVERLLADRPMAVRWAAFVFVAVLPAIYGPLDLIGFGEAYATPRGLAEAAGMAGMATYLSGRRFLALAVCVVGMVFHPIMGLCSAAAIGLAMCLEDRRWLWAGLAGMVLVTVAGLLRLPLADRIVTVMDPTWRAVVETRSPIVFPSQWPIETWTLMALHACTLAAGAVLMSGAPRRLALGALIAGLVGVAVTVVLGERFSLLLFLQLQSWRMLQPMAVLAAVCLAMLSVELPRRGPSGLWGLALLGLAWMFRDAGGPALAAALVGLACVVWGQRMVFSQPKLFSGVALGLLAVAAVVYGALRVVYLSNLLTTMPASWPFSLGYAWSSDLPTLVISLAVGIWLARGWRPPPAVARIAAVVMIGVLVLTLWDDRSPYVRERDQGVDPALAAMTASRRGEVLWLLGDIEPWVVMGRASWASRVQTAGVVFSRPLSLEMRARADRLKADGLVLDDWMSPPQRETAPPPSPNLTSVRAFCARPDAPAWIVWARWNDAVLDADLGAHDWMPKAPYVLLTRHGWLQASRYAVIPCAGD